MRAMPALALPQPVVASAWTDFAAAIAGAASLGRAAAERAITVGFGSEVLYAVSMPLRRAGSIYLLFDTGGGPRTINGGEARA